MRILEPVDGYLVDYAICPADTTNSSFVSIAGLTLV